MLSSKLFRFNDNLIICARGYKVIKNRWNPISKKTTSVDYALIYFDDFYGSVFGENNWSQMKKALHRKHKYVALVNNFADTDETLKKFNELGAHNMRNLFEAQKEFNKNSPGFKNPADFKNSSKNDIQIDYVESFAKEINKKEIESAYGNKGFPEKIDIGNTVIGDNSKGPNTNAEDGLKNPTYATSLLSSLNEPQFDESRIISPSTGMNSVNLWTYVPCTRLKGCEDWIPESDHFKYYSSAKDFPLTIEEDDDLIFPENLQVYSFESGSKDSFPEPRRGSAGVFNYYVMDGASILPILALGLKPGDKVLDLCAAPGGKSLTALQTLLTSYIVANDSSLSRVKRIHKVFEEYLYDYGKNDTWAKRVQLSNEDGRMFKAEYSFDKVLIDVPCTTDRLSLKENDNNIFRPNRLQERLQMPEIQSDLLSHALSLCKIGGTVVYSTCTLSPIQNDGVVHMGLKKAWEEYGVRATIKDLKSSFSPAISLFKFGRGRAAPKYGQLVVPDIYSNFGPSYFAKMVRTSN